MFGTIRIVHYKAWEAHDVIEARAAIDVKCLVASVTYRDGKR